MNDSTKSRGLELHRNIGLAIRFEDIETDIGTCLPIQVVVSVFLNFSSGIQIDSKSKTKVLKLSFENKSVRKNLFLSACFCWDSRQSLREMDQIFKFGGTIVYGDSYLEFFFRHFKILRLHAKLHEAAGAMRAHSVKGPKAKEEGTAEEDALVPLVTHVNEILQSIFSNVEVYINNQQVYNSNGLYAHKFYISNNFKGAISEYKEFCTARATTMRNFLMKLWKHVCLNLFSQGEWKCLADPMHSCFMVNWGLTFSPFLNCYIQIWKLGYE